MRPSPRQIHHGQDGFTLPELLTGMTVGLIVLLAAALLLDTAVSRSGQISDRQDATQRGRIAMERVARDLRSQVCLKTARPITYGDDNRVDFYANLTDNTEAADHRSIRYVATEKRLYEDVRTGSGPFPDLTFTTAPSTTTVLEGAAPAKETTTTLPLFRYYGYDPARTDGALVALGTPLSDADEQKVVLIKVAFATLPTRTASLTSAERDATTLQTDVYVRLADPTKPLEGPRCL